MDSVYQGHKIHGRCWQPVPHRKPTSQRSQCQRKGPGSVQAPEQSFLRSSSASSHEKQRPLQSRYGGVWKKLSAIAGKIGCVQWRALRALTTLLASSNQPLRCLLPTVRTADRPCEIYLTERLVVVMKSLQSSVLGSIPGAKS
jgi:hypothetical protein